MTLETAYVWDKQRQSFLVMAQTPTKFLKGPVPWLWLCAANKLPGAALAVGLAIWRLSGVKKSTTIRLATSEIEVMGVSRSAKGRALKALSDAGLIKTVQRCGCMPVVTILEVAPDPQN